MPFSVLQNRGEAAAAALRALAATSEPGAFGSAVVSAFPWATLLSDAEVDQFAFELADALQAGVALNNPTPLTRTIEAWRHTAEVYADPDLARILCAFTSGDGEAECRSGEVLLPPDRWCDWQYDIRERVRGRSSEEFSCRWSLG